MLLTKIIIMKSIILSKSRKTQLIIQVVLTFFFVDSSYSQIALLKANGQSDVFQFENLTIHSFGIKYYEPSTLTYNSYTPQSKFHIYDHIGNLALFQVEGFDYNASVKNILKIGTTVYGIYQSGPLNGLNFFENKILIGSQATSGTDLLKVNGNARICKDLYLNEPDEFGRYHGSSTISAGYILNFDLANAPQKGNKSLATVLTLDYLGIKTATVHGNLITETFQMTTTPANNYILASDALGNGSWINPKILLDNYWLLNEDDDLYTLKNVGIGTRKPLDKFQVNDGISKVVIGLGPENIYPHNSNSGKRVAVDGSGYLGFNTNYLIDRDEWHVSGNGSTNGGGLIYNSPLGDIFFSTLASSSGLDDGFTQTMIDDNTRIRICSTGGVMIGQGLVENTGTTNTLEIKKKGNVSLLLNAIDNDNHTAGDSYFVMKNSINDFFFKLDNTGTLKLYEGAWTPRLSFHNGRVGIGEVDIDSYDPTNKSKLWVAGGITTEEVTVKLKENWSDFVFNKDYKLRSISELAQYIETNKHLPDVPTSSDVAKAGIELGNMNALLLQKVEELSLYVIELKKELTDLQKKVNK
jgi:hypothetical protein